MSTAVRLVVAFLLALLSFGVLLPTAIAVARNHAQTASIAVWNALGLVLFGLGWLIALVKALTDGTSNNTTTVIVNNVMSHHTGKSTD